MGETSLKLFKAQKDFLSSGFFWMTENIHCSPDIETLSAFIAEGLHVVIIVSIYIPSDYNGHKLKSRHATSDTNTHAVIAC